MIFSYILLPQLLCLESLSVSINQLKVNIIDPSSLITALIIYISPFNPPIM